MSEPMEDSAAPILTAAAVDRVRAIVDASGESDLMLRVTSGEDGGPWVFSLDDRVGDDDVTVDFGVLTLVLDPEANARLQGCEIDHVDDDAGERFIVRRVNEGG